MSAKHTPGPWKGPCQPGSNFEKRISIKTMDGEVIAYLTKKNEDYNARFIVLCVNSHNDLVEALKAAKDEISEWQTHCDYRAEPHIQAAVKLIDAALAKARQ